MTSILIIPDAHAKPDVPNDRFEWLGEFIVEHQPDVIVNMGDFADMHSLSSYDRGKRSFEGRRVKEDIESAEDAMVRLMQPIVNLNDRNRANKQKLYRPRMIMLEGNHEYRLAKLMNDQPELSGVFDRDISGCQAFGWEWYPFLVPVTVEGITFSHYFNNAMGKPLGGKYPAQALLRELHTSCVMGHTHELHLAMSKTGNGGKIMAMVAGCYFDHNEYYAKQSNSSWDRCLTLLTNVEQGFTLDVSVFSIEEIKRRYSVTQEKAA